MNIMLKHVLRDIRPKKLLSMLVISSVVVASSLLFVSLSVTDAASQGNLGEQFTLAFSLVFLAASGMCVFIISSSFRVIVASRLET
ncbi:MAG: hypothetical protein FWE06_08070 [Oscillospiraceae bacterium]|nr:hypothetical protein [Oscillospiraceae bacterium]